MSSFLNHLIAIGIMGLVWNLIGRDENGGEDGFEPSRTFQCCRLCLGRFTRWQKLDTYSPIHAMDRAACVEFIGVIDVLLRTATLSQDRTGRLNFHDFADRPITNRPRFRTSDNSW